MKQKNRDIKEMKHFEVKVVREVSPLGGIFEHMFI